ncbi:O-antigen ligase [Curtobacterium sp. MCBD17_013]|uniref:O-antigen ligase family protein n=1 Tax=Curtobacterium sp. MCBD17_013 TaxID=2175668 RepID=UPI0015E8DD87|nr:O-antigen ligase family protein [Curtobacterium sp. MCBD17_013]
MSEQSFRQEQDAVSLGALTRVLVYLAAMTSSWSAVRVGSLNVSDVLLVLALLGLATEALVQTALVRVRVWMILPTLAGLLLVARDVIVWGRALNGAYLGEGLSPLQMLTRVSLSTLGIALVTAGVGARDRQAALRAIWWWLTGVCVSAAFALAQAMGLASLTLQQTNGAGRFAGLSSHPNALAQTAVLAIPLALVAVLRSRGSGRFMSFVLVILLGAAVFQTGSRAGLLVGFATLVLGALEYARRAKALRWALPICLFVVAAVVIYGSRVIGSTRFASDSGAIQSNEGRIQSINDGWSSFSSHPVFGAGFGIWVGELTPLVLLASGGGVFLAIYSWFALAPARSLWIARADPLAAALLMDVVLVLILGLLNNGFTERYTFWPALLGYALFGAGRSSVRRDRVTVLSAGEARR